MRGSWGSGRATAPARGGGFAGPLGVAVDPVSGEVYVSSASTGTTGKSGLPPAPTPAELDDKLATAFGLPSAKACFSRRAFKIHIQQPPGYPKVVSAEVFLGTRRIRSLSKKGLTNLVVLTGLPKGTFRIRIAARTATGSTLTGSTLTGTRTYHTCRSKPLKFRRPPPGFSQDLAVSHA
jgi:hypothetical protein